MLSSRDASLPLSILHVAAPAAVGGLETIVQNLASGHRGMGHRVGVIAVVDLGNENHPFLGPLAEAGGEVFPVGVARRGYLSERRMIREVCLRFRPDVVHTHGERPDVLDAGVARRLGIPTATTVHGSSKLGGVTRLYEWMQLRSFRRFDAIVSVSRPLVEELGRYRVAADRIHLVPNCWSGAMPELAREEARHVLGLPLDGFVVGWVGRLIPVKGVDTFLRAIAGLADVPLSASIVGDGPERATSESQATSLGLNGRVRFHGDVTNAARVFPAFDLFVLSSRTEGTPSVLFEAMAADVPMVVSRVGGVPDVVSEAEAYLVPPADPPALATAIRRAHGEPQHARARAAAARERLVAEFATDPWLSRYVAVYRRILRQDSGRDGLAER